MSIKKALSRIGIIILAMTATVAIGQTNNAKEAADDADYSTAFQTHFQKGTLGSTGKSRPIEMFFQTVSKKGAAYSISGKSKTSSAEDPFSGTLTAGVWEAGGTCKSGETELRGGYDLKERASNTSGRFVGTFTACVLDGALTKARFDGNWVKDANGNKTPCSFELGGGGGAGAAVTSAANAPVKFTDKRDGKVYNSVKIGSQVWMAENHNVRTENSWCYGGDDANCKKYGRLYTWEAAKKACSGLGGKWRLPTLADMSNLTKAVGGVREEYYNEDGEGGDGDNEKYIRYAKAAKKLKSKSGWNNCGSDGGESDGGDCVTNGNGTDDYGFAALPGGSRSPDGQYGSAGGRAYFWGATESVEDYAYRWHIYYGHDDVNEYYESRSSGFSVRCVSE